MNLPDARPSIDNSQKTLTLEEHLPSFETSTNRLILIHLLKPIMKWLEHPEVEEIQINRPGEIIQRLRAPLENGSLYAFHTDPTLSHSYLTMVAYTLANTINMKNFGPDGIPVVYGTTPGGHRLVAAVGPNIQYHESEISEEGSVCFVVRQFIKNIDTNLDRWGIKMGAPVERDIRTILSKDADPNDPYSQIFNSLSRGDHLLISGATGTGKTTLLRALVERIDPRLRIATVEDTRELMIPHRNRIHLLMSRSGENNRFDYKAVVDMIVRITPDVVMAGEISTSNAGAIWELMRSGHGHFMTTIHAESVDEAVSTFMSRIAHTTPEEVTDRDRIKEEMKKRMRIIQLVREGEKRRITKIV